MALTRRRFVHLLGSSALAVVAGCTRDPAPGPATTSTTVPLAPGTTVTDLLTDAPFSVWDDILRAIRTSPDHLRAQADRLVSDGDPEALFRFVRDSIRTVPPRPDGMRDAVSATRGGLRSVLRTGQGTPREKVELLTQLLNEAGFEAKVVQGVPSPGLEARPALLRPAPVEFAPDISDDLASRWLEALGMSHPGQIRRLDPAGEESGRLMSEVLAAMSEPPGATVFDWTVTEMPLVEVTVDGRKTHANPFPVDASWGEAYATAMIDSPPVVETATIGVAVSVSSTDDPSVRHTVAEATWPLRLLTGRRVIARFIPEGDTDAVLAARPAQLLTHRAVLVVEGPDVDLDDDESLAVFGSAVTTTGSVLEVVDDRLVTDGVEFGADPASADQVAALQMDVSAASFPIVRLRVSPTDGSGDPVFGIPADAISVSEDGVPVPFVMAKTRPPDPTVLMVFDTSASIPEGFRGDGAAAFAAGLASAISAGHPGTTYRFGGVASGSLAVAPTVVADPAAVEDEVKRVVGFGSDVWSALAQARFTRSTMIVLVSDGRMTDSPEAIQDARSWIGSGSPVVCIAVGDVERSALEEIAGLSGGGVFQVSQHEEAVGAIAGFLAELEATPIEILYSAVEDGAAAAREVTVRTSAASVSATYEVPSPVVRLDPPGLAGIYLTIRHGGQEVVRTIAGVAHETAVRTTVVDADLRREVHAALFGSMLLSVEAGAPTFAAWMDDALTTRKTWRPMLEAVERGESAFAAAIGALVQVVPGQLPVLHSRLEADESAVTYEIGPRMVLLAQRPLWDGSLISRADILPFTRFVTAGPEPREAFRVNVERTARLAIAEEMLFEDSTSSRLRGRVMDGLAPFAPAPRDGAIAGQAGVLDRYAAWHRLVPRDGEPFAFWAVDANGSVIGVLPDGSGGGSTKSKANEQCKTVGQAAGMVDLVGPAVGLPFAWGAFVALGKAIAKQAFREAAIIESLGGPLPDTSECGAPSDFPCDVAKSAFYDAIPYGKFVAAFDAATAAATGKDAVNCPGT